MRNNSPGDDPKKIWQNQPTDIHVMTLENIRQKIRELHGKTRRQLLGTLTAPLVAVAFYGFVIREFPPLRQGMHLLFAFALAWSLIGLYFLNRGMWSEAMPGDAGFSTGLEFCRREIERQRYLLRRILLWSFGPVIMAISIFILALAMVATEEKGLFPNALPFLILVFVWIIGYFIVRFRQQRELEREIGELNDIEKENG